MKRPVHPLFTGYIYRCIETWYLLNDTDPPEIINLGLSSETVSGLSEPDHPFPRPCLHTRLDRVLERTQPDLVIACYGMNCGIYHPFSEERCEAYQSGINPHAGDPQWNKLIRLVEQQRLTYDRALLNDIGHGNPNVMKNATRPLAEAEARSKEFDAEIEAAIAGVP